MIQLFVIDDKYELELNKAWLLMIPAFAQIIKKDKGSTGDYRGDKKLMAKKKLGFVYLMIDFASPLRELEEFERRKRAMNYLSLTEQGLNDPDLVDALATYKKILYGAARALRTLDAVKRGLDAMDSYFENVNFTSTDRQGKLLYSPKEYVANITEVKKAYQSLGDLEQSVMDDLSQASEARGDVELGDMEEDRKRFRDLLTMSEIEFQQQAQNRMKPPTAQTEPKDWDEENPFKVVDRPAKKITGGDAFTEMGDAIRLALKTEEEDPEEEE